MRRSSETQFVVDDNNVFYGIFMAADFCAEHEWGIKTLTNSFGIQHENLVGIEARTARNVPTSLRYEQKDNMAILTIGYRIYYSDKGLFDSIPSELKYYSKKNNDNDFITSAWSEKDFGILVKGQENINKLSMIHEAIKSNNVAVFLGNCSTEGKRSYRNSGLIVALLDTFPEKSATEMKEADEDCLKLVKTAEETGIEKKICENIKTDFFKPYYALSPAWKKNQTSKYDVVFWLNPINQNKNNYGWFTVEELEQWIEGKGPIPKAQ
jgi:hypothetical protein